MTCAEFEEAADLLWKQWCVDSAEAETNQDPEAWDAAFASYIIAMETLREGYGHPPGKPRKRP